MFLNNLVFIKIKKCPTLAFSEMLLLYIFLTSLLIEAPVRVVVNISTAKAKAAPLAPPIGNKEPLRASLGFSVLFPKLSIAQLSGIAFPYFFANIILPLATVVIYKSIITGFRFLIG